MRNTSLLLATLTLVAPATSFAVSSIGSTSVSTTGIMEAVSYTISGAPLIPAGAIWAFDLTTCPTGWSEYTAARGRFLRGIDNAAGNDPSGTRVPGNTQEDALQGHVHANAGLVSAPGAIYNGSTRNEGAYGTTTGPATLTGYGAVRFTSETRPKNVAVLFCRKD